MLVAQSCLTLCKPVDFSMQASLSITNYRSLLKLMSIELVMPSNHLILCCALLLLPSIFPSIRVFSNESVLRIRWPKYWSFSFNISSSPKIKGQCVYHFYKSKGCSIISEPHNTTNDSITDEKANMPDSSIK